MLHNNRKHSKSLGKRVFQSFDLNKQLRIQKFKGTFKDKQSIFLQPFTKISETLAIFFFTFTHFPHCLPLPVETTILFSVFKKSQLKNKTKYHQGYFLRNVFFQWRHLKSGVSLSGILAVTDNYYLNPLSRWCLGAKSYPTLL